MNAISYPGVKLYDEPEMEAGEQPSVNSLANFKKLFPKRMIIVLFYGKCNFFVS